jgi:hypothetical protein
MAHLGHCGDQEGQPCVVPSEKYAACRGRVSDGMRIITPCFARALERGASCVGVHFHLTFQEVTTISKTRNQLRVNYEPSPLAHMLLCAQQTEYGDAS